MFEHDAASEGLITVGDLRKRTKGVDSRAVVHVCVDGFTYAPLTDAKFEKPDHPDEGQIGVFLVMPDPSSELVQSLPGDPAQAIKTKHVTTVTVIDPDSKLPVEVEIRKLETGGMVGIDGSYLEGDVGDVYSPYDNGVQLNIPDDEEG